MLETVGILAQVFAVLAAPTDSARLFECLSVERGDALSMDNCCFLSSLPKPGIFWQSLDERGLFLVYVSDAVSAQIKAVAEYGKLVDD
jgi:hypothetical protein